MKKCRFRSQMEHQLKNPFLLQMQQGLEKKEKEAVLRNKAQNIARKLLLDLLSVLSDEYACASTALQELSDWAAP